MRSEEDALAGRRVLVLISGSIAAVKLPQLVSALVQRGALVRCVLSPGAERLVSAVALASLSRAPCHIEADQWSHQESRPLHIALAEWAEVVLLAPLSATSLARWVHGMADTLLASTLIACEVPVVAAPAMNSAMWAAPAVRRNWRELQGWERVLPLDPGSGLLACDRVGDGRMADPELLLLALESLLVAGCRRDWAGRRLLVSAGPTREALDPARCLTNPSTGRMGVLLAQAARLRGATVDLVHGPLAVDPAWLEGLQCHPVVTAAEMEAALLRLQDGADAIAMAAAVADHRRRSPEHRKLPKEALEASLTEGWEPVPDLLAALAWRRPPAQAIPASPPRVVRCSRRPGPSSPAKAAICCSPTPSTGTERGSGRPATKAGCSVPASGNARWAPPASWPWPTVCSRRSRKRWPSGLRIGRQQIHERAQLQPGDVGPAAAAFHLGEQGEQAIAVAGQAAAEGAVLDAAVQVLDAAQQIEQGLGLLGALLSDPQQGVEGPLEFGVGGWVEGWLGRGCGRRRGRSRRGGSRRRRREGRGVVDRVGAAQGHLPLIQVVESPRKPPGMGVLHR